MASGEQQPERARTVRSTGDLAKAGRPTSAAAEVAALHDERRRLMAALAAKSEELEQRTRELAALRAELIRLRGTAGGTDGDSLPGLSDNDWDRLVGDDHR